MFKEWANMPLDEVHEQLASRDVKLFPIGCCIYEECNYSVDVKYRTFLWFESIKDLILYLAIIEFPARFGDSEHDLQQACELLNEAYESRDDYKIGKDKEEEETLIREDMLVEINELLVGNIKIEWCGYFEELACSGKPFPKKVRELYWNTQAEKKASSQIITKDMFDDLFRFLITINDYFNEQNYIWNLDTDEDPIEDEETLRNIIEDKKSLNEYKFKLYHKEVEEGRDI